MSKPRGQVQEQTVVRLPTEPHLHTPRFELSGGAVHGKLKGMGTLVNWNGRCFQAWTGQSAFIVASLLRGLQLPMRVGLCVVQKGWRLLT